MSKEGQEKKLQKSTMKKVENSFESFLENTGEDRIVLIKNRPGKISFLIENKSFTIRYRSTKYPEGKMEFSAEDETLEDWIYNVNEALEKNMTLEKALNVSLEFYGQPSGSDDFGSFDDDFGSFDDDFGSFDAEDFDEMNFDDFDNDMGDISIVPDELEMLRMKKRWKDKEAELRVEKEAERERLRQKNKSMFKRNDEDKVEQIFTSSAASGVLTNDLLNIMEKSTELGFNASPIDDNIYHWSVNIFHFNNRDMKRQMTELEETYGYNYVELEIEFTLDLYPFYPPLVKVLRPRFQGFMMGRITTLDILKLENWDPIKNMSDIIELIKNMLDENSRVDVSHEMNNIVEFPDGAYTKLEHLLLELDLLSDVDSRANKKYPMQDEIVKGKATKNSEKTETKEDENPQSGSSYWAKGTGYGHTGASSETWNVDAYLAAQKEKDIQLEKVMQGIKVYLEDKLDSLPEDGQKLQAIVIEESCLIPCLELYFDNDSLLDMGRHESLYLELFALTKALAMNYHTTLLLDTLPQQRISILRLLKKMNRTATLFEEAMAKGNSDMKQGQNILVEKIIDLYLVTSERVAQVKEAHTDTPLWMMGWEDIVEEEDELDDEGKTNEIYLEAMAELQFDHLDLMSSAYNHHYKGNAGNTSTKEQIMRIAQETGALATSLPLNTSSTVFLRLDEDRIDFMSAMITGPEDTPYSGGCYVFDIYFPQNYPNGPPNVWLVTTGGNTFRFNPNLYANGKVCLSLLGTWSGSAGENWNKDTSTLLQVLVSIQSLIMVPDPYFNEPGYERSMGTPTGDANNKNYNDSIREGTLRIAMIGQLKNPKHGYEEIIRTHFKLQKSKLLKQAKQWRNEAKGSGTYNKMCTLVQEFESELNKLE